MADIGSQAVAVNSRKFNVYVGNTTNEFVYLQNARMGFTHTEDPEDTTSGGVVYFSSNDRYFLEGTILYTKGIYNTNIDGEDSIEGILDRENGETTQKTWLVRMTAKDGTSDTYSFTAKLEQFEPNMSVPGGTKVDIRLIILGPVTVS